MFWGVYLFKKKFKSIDLFFFYLSNPEGVSKSMEIFGYNLETIFVWGKYFHFARRPLFCSRNVNWLKLGETLTSTDSSSSSPPDFTLGLSGQPPFNSLWRPTKCKVKSRILLNQNTALLPTFRKSQAWHLNFSQLFDDLGHENHIFSESISSRLTILISLTTWPPDYNILLVTKWHVGFVIFVHTLTFV